MSHDIKAGVAAKKVATYLAYLTRLRQAVAHPFLLEGVMKASFTLEDFAYLRRQLASVGGKTPMHRQMQKWIQIEYDISSRQQAEDVGEGGGQFGRSRFGYEFDMERELEEVGAGKTLQEVICRVCYDVPVDPRITQVMFSVPFSGVVLGVNLLTCACLVWTQLLPGVHRGPAEGAADLPGLRRVTPPRRRPHRAGAGCSVLV
jgi:hypothetical protein